MELYEFFQQLHQLVLEHRPVETERDGCVFYNDLSPLTFYMMHKHPDVEFTDRMSICRYLKIRNIDWKDLCHMTREFMVRHSVTNPFYFV